MKEHAKSPSFQAYRILHVGYILLPLLAGVDKFFNFLTMWEKYLSTPFNIFGNPRATMMTVGVIEILAAIGVWVKPRIFAYVVAVWLLAILINLLVFYHFYDIALRDFGLFLGALALGRLSAEYDN